MSLLCWRLLPAMLLLAMAAASAGEEQQAIANVRLLAIAAPPSVGTALNRLAAIGQAHGKRGAEIATLLGRSMADLDAALARCAAAATSAAMKTKLETLGTEAALGRIEASMAHTEDRASRDSYAAEWLMAVAALQSSIGGIGALAADDPTLSTAITEVSAGAWLPLSTDGSAIVPGEKTLTIAAQRARLAHELLIHLRAPLGTDPLATAIRATVTRQAARLLRLQLEDPVIQDANTRYDQVGAIIAGADAKVLVQLTALLDNKVTEITPTITATLPNAHEEGRAMILFAAVDALLGDQHLQVLNRQGQVLAARHQRLVQQLTERQVKASNRPSVAADDALLDRLIRVEQDWSSAGQEAGRQEQSRQAANRLRVSLNDAKNQGLRHQQQLYWTSMIAQQMIDQNGPYAQLLESLRGDVDDATKLYLTTSEILGTAGELLNEIPPRGPEPAHERFAASLDEIGALMKSPQP